MKMTIADIGESLLLADRVPAELILAKQAHAHYVIISHSMIIVLLYKELTMNV